jgi:membrane protein YdbS with pleckstrin-like domain
VQNVNYDQTVLDRMFRVGTVDFDTAGSDDSEFRFEWVNDPDDVVRAVHDATVELGPTARL